MPRNTKDPQNALERQALWERQVHKIGIGLLELENGCIHTIGDWGEVTAVRFRAPALGNSEWLAVISVKTENGAVVAFHSADSLVETMTGLAARIKNGSLKWKEDDYAK